MAQTKAMPPPRAAAHDVRGILGEFDAETVAAILATGIAVAELVEVREWMDADAIIRAQRHRNASGAVAAVCDIIADEERDEAFER